MNYADKYKAALIQSLMPGQNQQNRHWLEAVGNVGRTAAGMYLSKRMADDLKTRRDTANAAIMKAMQPQTVTQNLQVQGPQAVSGPQAGAMGGSPVGEPGERPGFQVPVQIQKPTSPLAMLGAIAQNPDASPALTQAAMTMATRKPEMYKLGAGESLVDSAGNVKASGAPKVDYKPFGDKIYKISGGELEYWRDIPKGQELFSITKGDKKVSYVGVKGDPSSWVEVGSGDAYRPTTIIDMGKGDETAQKSAAEYRAERIKGGRAASMSFENMRLMLNLLDAGQVNGGDFTLYGRSVLRDLGTSESTIDSIFGGDTANLELFNGILNREVLQAQILQSGPQTESDAKRISQTIASINNPAAANQLLLRSGMATRALEMREASLYRSLRKGELKNDYVALQEAVEDKLDMRIFLELENGAYIFWNEWTDLFLEQNPQAGMEEALAEWRKVSKR